MNVKFAFVGLVCAIAGMDVQSNAETTWLLALMDQPTVLDAFSGQYGQTIVGELAKILTEQGDAACRKAQNLGGFDWLRKNPSSHTGHPSSSLRAPMLRQRVIKAVQPV